MESSALLSPARGIARLAILVLVIAPVAAVAAEELPIAAHWIGPETPVSAAAGVLASDPDVAATADGHALVVWQQAERDAPAATRALARLRSPDGGWGDVFVLTDGPLTQPPTVNAVGPYNFVVTWAEAAGAGVRIVDASGGVAPRVTLRPELGGATAFWRALLVPPGRLVTCWTENVRVNGRRHDLSLRSRAIGRLGKPLAPGETIEEWQLGSGLSFDYETLDLASNGPASVAVWQGTGCAVYGPGGQDCETLGARGARLGVDGAVLGTFSVGNGDTLTYRPALATTPGGEFVVAWWATSLDAWPTEEAAATGIVARRLDTDGRPTGAPLVIKGTPPFGLDPKPTPVVAVDPVGGYLVVWGATSAQAVGPDDAKLGGELQPTTGRSTRMRAVAAAGFTDYLVAGTEQITSEGNGLDQRVVVQRLQMGSARLSLSADLVSTDEDGNPATFDVLLPFAPTAPVTLELSIDPPGAAEVQPATLEFAPEDWAEPRTVTVRGVDDGLIQGDVAAAVVTAQIVSTDPRFAGYDPPDVRIRRLGDKPCAAGVGIPERTYWVSGRLAEVYWRTIGEGCGNVHLDLLRGEQTIAVVGDDLPTSPEGTHIDFTPPALALAGDYRLRLTMPSRPSLVALSETFWAGPPIACATAIATPRQGEQWQRGRPHRIRWSTTGDCTGHRLRIELDGRPIAHRVLTTRRSFLWQVPATQRTDVYGLALVDADDPRARSLPRYFQVTP